MRIFCAKMSCASSLLLLRVTVNADAEHAYQ